MTFLLAVFYAVTNISGIVTFARDGDDYFFMKDASSEKAWRVTPRSGTRVEVGDVVRVTGRREFTSKPRISATSIRRLPRHAFGEEEFSRGRTRPAEIAVEELFSKLLPYGNADLYGQLLSVEGLIIDINRRQKSTQLLIGRNNCNFQLELPLELEMHLPKDMVLGACVKVTGVLVYTSIEDVEQNISRRIENIEIMPQSVSDVVITELAPFWTVPRISWAFGIVFAFTVALVLFLVIRRRWDNTLYDARLRERLRIAADLHDGFQQYLAGSMFRLQAAMNLLPADAEASRRQLEGVRDALQHTQNGLRSTLWAMTEESEGPESLMELIRYASNRMAHWENIVTVTCEGREHAVARKLAMRILLIIQEGVANALKHGGAKHVAIKLVFGDAGGSVLRLEISDDGCGFDASESRKPGHYGLRSMEKRCRELGGEMEVESSSSGTKLSFVLHVKGTRQ